MVPRPHGNVNTSPALRVYRVCVQVSASADASTLLRLLSVFHRRFIPVLELIYTMKGDGASQMDATFKSSPTGAVTLGKSLPRVVFVTGVSLDEAAIEGGPTKRVLQC